MTEKKDDWPFDHIDATPEELARAMFKKPGGSSRGYQTEKTQPKKSTGFFRRFFRLKG